MSATSKYTQEFLVLSEEEISSTTYLNTKQPKHIKVIYVDQFNDKLFFFI